MTSMGQTVAQYYGIIKTSVDQLLSSIRRLHPAPPILDFLTYLVYKLFMQLTSEIKTSLKREYSLYSSAMAFYKKAVKEFEQKYHLTTPSFLKKFESGQMGDEADFFDWYAFAKLLAEWQETRAAIQTAIR